MEIQIIFEKSFISYWSEEVFLIKKVKNTVSWTNVTSDPNGEEIVGTFYEEKSQKTIKQSLDLEK